MTINLYDILQEVLNESVNGDVVSQAISNKKRVLISYSDEKNRAPGSRLIEPYVLGLSKAGNPCLRAYQYYGDTVRGVPKWKLFRLDRINSWKETQEHFVVTPREGGWNAEEYNRNGDRSMTEVWTMVNFANQNGDELYSPNNRLQTARANTARMQQSTPNKLNHMTDDSPVDLDTNNPSGPISTNDTTSDNNNPRGAVNNTTTTKLGDKDNNYWDAYDKAEQEKNQQTSQDRYNLNKRDKRWQQSVDTQRKWRKGALNDNL